MRNKEKTIPGIYIIQHFKKKEIEDEKKAQAGIYTGCGRGTDKSKFGFISYCKKYLGRIWKYIETFQKEKNT